jgi:hypothetical protein
MNLFFIRKTNLLILVREVIAVPSGNHAQRINILCGQKVDFFNDKEYLTYNNNHCDLK